MMPSIAAHLARRSEASVACTRRLLWDGCSSVNCVDELLIHEKHSGAYHRSTVVKKKCNEVLVVLEESQVEPT